MILENYTFAVSIYYYDVGLKISIKSIEMFENFSKVSYLNVYRNPTQPVHRQSKSNMIKRRFLSAVDHRKINRLPIHANSTASVSLCVMPLPPATIRKSGNSLNYTKQVGRSETK